jgi:hypothetical protein
MRFVCSCANKETTHPGNRITEQSDDVTGSDQRRQRRNRRLFLFLQIDRISVMPLKSRRGDSLQWRTSQCEMIRPMFA